MVLTSSVLYSARNFFVKVIFSNAASFLLGTGSRRTMNGVDMGRWDDGALVRYHADVLRGVLHRARPPPFPRWSACIHPSEFMSSKR